MPRSTRSAPALPPELWSETYATADIIAYDGVPMVKAGREFLLRKRKDE
jgi:nicotinate phosphoribosyltransferase